MVAIRLHTDQRFQSSEETTYNLRMFLFFIISSLFTNPSDSIQVKSNIRVYTTESQSNIKLAKSNTVLSFSSIQQPKEVHSGIFVNPKVTFQTFVGIGAALTDAAAETFYKLDKDQQELFLESYFSRDKGIGYTLARTIIHSCDFSSESYTYIEEGDESLETFSIERDLKYRIPFTKRVLDVATKDIVVYASPWSPPAFMKTNGNMLFGGKLKKEYYPAWANYFAKFIKAYEKEGIPIWGMTIQNEPMAVQRWESCIYTAEEERDFLKNHLGPTLGREGLQDKKIIVWDHNRDLLFDRASVILNDPEANKYVWGTGFHWYEDWKDGKPMFNNVGKVATAFPDKKLIFTEGCNEGFDINRIEDPKLPERYAKAMINDFNNGTVAWTDWNILLNEYGGPNHVGNFCFAPVHGDTNSGELLLTNSYYYIGHFSKFIRPGAKRVSTGTTSNRISSTSFMNKDGSLIVIALNEEGKSVDYFLTVGDKSTQLNIPKHSIQTIVFDHLP